MTVAVPLIALFLAFTLAEVTQQTLCQKYSQALGVTQVQLMTSVVSAVVTAEVSDTRIRLFFDGTLPPGSTNFLNNTSELTRLANNLVAYFGAALGCNDASFPRYMGNPDMKAVHMKMPIDYDTFDRFNSLFVGVLRKLGVDSNDASAIGAMLESFAPKIVNPLVLCGKYSAALGLTEVEFMIDVITTVVKTELKDLTILPFFNGQTPPGSTNFLTNKTAFDRLAGNLVAFFWRCPWVQPKLSSLQGKSRYEGSTC